MSRKYPNLQLLIEKVRAQPKPVERIILPPPGLPKFLRVGFIGINLLAWAALASDIPIWTYLPGFSGLSGGVIFAAFLIAEMQESIVSQFELFFLVTVSLLSGGIVGRWIGNSQLVFLGSGLAFWVIASFGLKTLLTELTEHDMWIGKSFQIRSVVLTAPFMFALATSTASFATVLGAEALRFVVPAVVGFTYLWLCPPSVFHPRREIVYQLLTLTLAAGLGIGCVIGFTNLLVGLALISSLLFLGATRLSIANFER